jgi:hypothetical protein
LRRVNVLSVEEVAGALRVEEVAVEDELQLARFGAGWVRARRRGSVKEV